MKFVIITCLAITCMIACTKNNVDIFVTDPGNIANDTFWRDVISRDAPVSLLKASLKKPYATATLNAATGGTIVFDEQLQLTFPADCFASGDNKKISGTVKVNVAFLRSKGDIIRFSKPTTSKGVLLESGGSFDVSVTKDEALFIAPQKNFTISYIDAQPKQGMQVFYGDSTVTNDFNFDWIPTTDSSLVNIWSDSAATAKGYMLTAHQLRWINCDYIIHQQNNAYATISVLMPLNFTNNNTVVYAVFKHMKTVAGLAGDAVHKIFTADNFTAGSDITLVSISKIGSAYYLGTVDVTVSNAQRVDITPQQKTLQQIASYLNTL